MIAATAAVRRPQAAVRTIPAPIGIWVTSNEPWTVRGDCGLRTANCGLRICNETGSGS
jgi:hypothetical protein